MFTNNVKCVLKFDITDIGLSNLILTKYNAYSNLPKLISQADSYGNKIYLTIVDRFSDKNEIISYTYSILGNNGTELTLGNVTRGINGISYAWNKNDCFVIQALTANNINDIIPAIGYKKIPFYHNYATPFQLGSTNVNTFSTISELSNLTRSYLLDITALVQYNTTIYSKIKIISIYDADTTKYVFNPLDCINSEGELSIYMDVDGSLQIKNLSGNTIEINSIFGLIEFLGI